MAQAHKRSFRNAAGRRAPLLAAASLLLSSAPVFAQDTEDEEIADPGEELYDRTNEIIVTAQFREQTLQSTPLAITASSGELLEGSRPE